MSGNLGQLTSSELTDAIEAVEVLYKLGQYLDRMAYVRIGTLRADLAVEREDREHTSAEATAEAKAETGTQTPVSAT
jgi:hypothetical protein